MIIVKDGLVRQAVNSPFTFNKKEKRLFPSNWQFVNFGGVLYLFSICLLLTQSIREARGHCFSVNLRTNREENILK